MDLLQIEMDAFHDDLEIVEIVAQGFPRRIYERHSYINELDELSFFQKFRLTKQTVLNILELIENRLEYPLDRNFSVSPINQLLITLRFYATGEHLLSIADFGGMHVSTVSRIIKRVSEAIASLLPQYVRFPLTNEGIQRSKTEFYQKASFPNVIGAIDCTHVRIQSPGGVDAEVFRNRKGYFSINVQAICNARMEIIDLVARWPGSAHDATIFNSSTKKADFVNGLYPNCILLGDSAYNIRPFMMTPLLNPITGAEQLYNESQIRTRGVIEIVFGVWKRRFPVLAYGCRLKLETTLTVIVATSVLHNIAQQMGEGEPPVVQDNQQLNHLIAEGYVPNIPVGQHHINRGAAIRRQIIDEYFGRL